MPLERPLRALDRLHAKAPVGARGDLAKLLEAHAVSTEEGAVGLAGVRQDPGRGQHAPSPGDEAVLKPDHLAAPHRPGHAPHSEALERELVDLPEQQRVGPRVAQPRLVAEERGGPLLQLTVQAGGEVE